MLSSDGENGGNAVAPLRTYAEKFRELFPYYLSIGMTESQYWDGDSSLVKYYREADKMRQERMNHEAWLQGAYFYEALARISPILHAYAKKGTRPEPYLSEPFALTKEDVKKKEEEKEKKAFNKGKQFMERFAVDTNKKFEGK